jgi:superfamily II DNA/RNA helicase
MAWLQRVVKPDGRWNNERVIIFHRIPGHAKLAARAAGREGLGSTASADDPLRRHGQRRRERLRRPFQARPGQSEVRILLATDAASEGIDLQNHCHRLVHFEIPWNPNRMEQRNGRIDRHGQQHDPEIYHFAGKGYRQRLPTPRRCPQRPGKRPGISDARPPTK